ncbi:MAG: copper resistance CopC family protein, partial [Gemmatimonadales bacterium]
MSEPDWVRWLRAAATISFLAVSAGGAFGATRTLLHATLLRSTPAADSRLHEPPETIRLVFSERVVPELSQITLVRPDSVSAQLKLASDPHDVRTLVGQVAGSEFREGKYKVTWRVVSADGHAVGGSFVFSLEPRGGVSGPSAVSIVGKPSRDSAALRPYDAPSHMPGSDERSVPVLASLLRGVGLGALMMGIGILFFGSTAGEHRSLMPGTLVISLTGIGALLLVI